jgi:protein ImuB
MKRVMCIWFPNWPIQRRLAARPSDRSRALVLHSPPSAGKVQVINCSRRARERGVKPRMLLAEAQALWPASSGQSVRFEQHDLIADRQGLRELAVWGQQFSPIVAIDAAEMPDCLLLDATGCGRGEEELAEKAVASLERRGYRAVAVVADNIATAWAVAHYPCGRQAAYPRTIIVPAELKNLSPQPPLRSGEGEPDA